MAYNNILQELLDSQKERIKRIRENRGETFSLAKDVPKIKAQKVMLVKPAEKKLEEKKEEKKEEKPKVEVPKTEIKKEEPPKVEPPKTEIKKEKPKVEPPKTEIKKEEKKDEKPKTEQPVVKKEKKTEKEVPVRKEVKKEVKKEKKDGNKTYRIIDDDEYERTRLPKATVNHKIILNIDHSQYPKTQDMQGCWAAAMSGMFNVFTGKKVTDKNALSISKVRNADIKFRDTKGAIGFNGLGLLALDKASQKLINDCTRKNGSLDYVKIQKELTKVSPEIATEVNEYIENVQYLERQIQAVHDFKDKNGAHNAGNVYMMSDILLDELAKAGKQAGVKITRFNGMKHLAEEKFVRNVNGKEQDFYEVTDRKLKQAEPEIIAYKNQVLDVIADSLGKNAPVTILYQGHYLMITGIDGEKLHYIHSMERYGQIFTGNKGTVELDDVLKGIKNNQLELTALEPIGKNKEEMMQRFKNLQIDESGNVTAKGAGETLFQEDQIAQTKGVTVENSASGQYNDRKDIYYGQAVYFPKKLTFK